MAAVKKGVVHCWCHECRYFNLELLEKNFIPEQENAYENDGSTQTNTLAHGSHDPEFFCFQCQAIFAWSPK